MECTVKGCIRKVYALGFCNTHYNRSRAGWSDEEMEKPIKVIGRGHLTAEGYRVIYPEPNQRTLEHRYVMEKYLGRPITTDENVHHKNGDRADNRLSNLELWSTMQPSGKRVSDLLDFAHEIISKYS